MKPVVKGAIAVAVLVLAAVVALVPRWSGDGGTAQRPSADPAVLSAARQQAQLPPCPQPSGKEQIDPVAAFEGVTATCAADGSMVRLDRALAGEVTLVNVWATWCQPCREELPVLEAYARSAEGPDSANVLAVQVSSGMVDGLRLLAELDVDLPVVHDGTGNRGPVRAALGIPSTLPASYVIAADGTVTFVERPRVFHTPAQVRRVVEKHSGIEGGGSR